MKYLIQSLCLLLCVVLFPFTAAKASHIVGGEMTYNCLGNNQYEILLTIFRDCENGNPGAYFDDPAHIGVFSGSTGAYLFTTDVFLPHDDTLDLTLSNPCYVIPPDVCIHTTTYRRQLTLPFRVGGYHLAYQRCCRNSIIVNIVDPTNTGATYDVQISEAALLTCNSSPRFREWPPFYICGNTPIIYDNSAFDPDGDSIVYELCSPFKGGGPSLGGAAPNPPSSPPYTPITWQFPYNVNNMLGGAVPFAIDPVTGMLSGTSPNVGTFVVGICAKEYRNGVLIGMTKRDFQYTVGTCNKAVLAQFVASPPPCNSSLSLLHLNASTPGNSLFEWDFGDNSPTIVATNPVHTYPDTGTYTIRLIAGAGQPCSDTTYKQINIQLDGADVVAPVQTACLGDTVLLVAMNGLANYNTITSWNWSPGGQILSGQGTDSVWVVASGNISLNVSVTNDNGCSDSDPTGVQIEIVDALFDTIDFVCNTSLDVPFVNQSVSVGNVYAWDFGGTGTSALANPTHTFPDTGTYTITLIAGIGELCQDTVVQDIYIPLDGAEILSTAPTQACKDDTVSLSVVNVLDNYNNILGYTWSPSSLVLSGQGTDVIRVIADTNMTFSIAAFNENGCTDTIITTIEVLQINAEFDSINLQCNKSLTVPFNNTSVDLGVGFIWDFGGTGSSTAVHPTHNFPDTGAYLVSLIGGIGTPCPDTFTQNVLVPIDGAEITVSDTQIVCRGDTVLLTATNLLATYNDIINYSWTPAANIITGQGSDSVEAIASGNIDFVVVGLNDEGCLDTAETHINVTFLSPILSIIANPDHIFVGQMSQLYASNFVEYIYAWTPDTTLSALDIHDPEARPRQTTTYYLSVSNEHCTHNDSVTVYIKDPICDGPLVFVPSAFTPDGDGNNDVLLVNGNNVDEMTIAIYNRWGQKVFESSDQSIGWDGTFKGQQLPPDVYGYYMQCTCDDGGTLFQKGNITLLR